MRGTETDGGKRRGRKGLGGGQRGRRGSEVDGGRSEVDGGGEVRLYHDITPLLCRYVSERRRASSTSKGTWGTLSGGRGGVRGIRVLEVEFLYSGWGVDLRVGEPHVIRVGPSNELNQVP